MCIFRTLFLTVFLIFSFSAFAGYETTLQQAKQGDALAQYDLGTMYDSGQEVTQDYKEAIKWYRLSAEQGYALAQYNLGTMYAQGQGIAQDYKEAFKWYQKAAEQGEALAQCNLG
ncbi:MAG: sel1 repeat family protein, partial [Methylococcaceae bacterium]|nr:sel1 repeat family protein [Methylococcaceae bacterium]